MNTLDPPEEEKEYHAAYYQRNKEKLLAHNKQWAEKNKDKLKKYTAEYYKKNKTAMLENRKAAKCFFEKENPVLARLAAAKHRANKLKVPFNLDISDLIIPEYCPILGIPLVNYIGAGKGFRPDSISLDRNIPELGYIKGNVQIISGLANLMKNNATPEQLIAFAEWVFKTYKE